jgi:hypothetical protein
VVPQAAFVLPALQMLPSQQPPGQLAGVQTQEPFWHCVPLGHVTQTPPPAPQAALEVPASQVLPSQQPLGQLTGVQMHVPFWHSWPATQVETHVP